MEFVAYLHSEMLCERLQQGESLDQNIDCQMLSSISQSSRHAKSALCIGLAAGAIALNTMPTAVFAYTPEIASIQELLARRGFNPGAIDGVKGSATTEAIVAAQTFYKLDADGVVGAQTLAALQADTYEANSPVATPISSDNGSSGHHSSHHSDHIKNVQQLLIDRGFYGGAVDGIKGSMTEEAIILAQKSYGLIPDGIAGSLTVQALKVGSNYTELSYQDADNSVKNVQQLLSDRGFYGGAIDGIKGPMTEEAIILAQKSYGLIPDGVAGSLTVQALQVGSNYTELSYQEPTGNVSAGVGSNSIAEGQELLSSLGFYDGAIDGIQGSRTTDAIKKAQTLYNLPVDGVLGSDTLKALQS